MSIIAPVDRSKRAKNIITEAGAIAEAFDDEVHIIHVMSISEFTNLGKTSYNEGNPVNMAKIRQEAATVAEKWVEDLHVPYKIEGLVGKPVSEIVQYANNENARYIVLSGKKRSPAGKAVFGSTTQSVLLNTSIPIVVTSSETPE